MFRPLRSAAANSSSMADAKCDPNTSALVVPEASRPPRNSSATSRAYARLASLLSSGRAHRSSQSSSGMPSPPIARIWGKWTCVSTKPGTSIPSGSWVTGSPGYSAHSAASVPRAQMTPSRTQTAPASASASAGSPSNGSPGVSTIVPA